MVELKRIFNITFILTLLILNILDFFQYITKDLEFLNNLLSWILMTYLLYHLGFTKILIGYKNRWIDSALLVSYTLFIVKDLLFYLSSAELEIVNVFTDIIRSYGSMITFISFNAAAFMIIAISVYISLRVLVEDESLLGAFSLNNKRFPLKFIISLLSVSFVAYFIFMMVFEWFGIVIDAPLAMIGIAYYLIVRGKDHEEGRRLKKISEFGERLLDRFIGFFHSKKTLHLGILSLLIMHFFTDLCVFIIPTLIKIRDPLYHSVLNDEGIRTVLALFLENMKGLDMISIVNLIVVYIINISFILILFIAPILIIIDVYNDRKIDLDTRIDIIAIAGFVFYLLFPIYKISSINSLISGVSGVNITLSLVKTSGLLTFAIPILFFTVLVSLLIEKSGRFDITNVSMILLFVPIIDYVLKYFKSTIYYNIELIKKGLTFDNALIVFFMLIFLLLIIAFYWTSILILIYEFFRLNYRVLFDSWNQEKVDELKKFLFYALSFYVLAYYISIIFGIFRIDIDFFIPIILALLLLFMHRIDSFFIRLDFGIGRKNFLMLPLAVISGFFCGASLAYFREPLVFRSENLILLGVYILFVAISEEILFRYYLQNYTQNIIGFKPAMFVQSLVFAAMHYSKGISLVLFVSLFLSGVIFTYIKEKTGLFNAIVAHITANIILYYYFL